MSRMIGNAEKNLENKVRFALNSEIVCDMKEKLKALSPEDPIRELFAYCTSIFDKKVKESSDWTDDRQPVAPDTYCCSVTVYCNKDLRKYFSSREAKIVFDTKSLNNLRIDICESL